MDTKALRQKILDLAIRGKLVPQDPNDEPAEVLLERIREQKQQMFKEGKLKKKDIKNDTIIFKGEDNLHYEKFQDGTVKCIEDEIPFEVPEGWCWVRVRDIAMVKGGKRLPKGASFSEEITTHAYIRVTDMKNHSVNISNLRYISDEIFSAIKNYTIAKDDLYVTIAGTIGVVGEIPDKLDGMNLTENAVKITNIAINKSFLCIILQTDFVQQQFQNKTHQVAMPKLALERILSTFIPICPYVQQLQIVDRFQICDNFLSTIDTEKEELQKIVSLSKYKILDLAIRGKLVPQDPNDEPASVILERIRTEKEELIKQGKIKRDKKESVIFKGDDNSYYERVGDIISNIDDEIPFELPQNWEWSRLQTICYPITDGTHKTPTYSDSGYIFLSAKNITTGKINWNDIMYIPKSLHDELYSRVSPKMNDILLAKNGTTGVAAIVDRECEFDIYVTLALLRVVNNNISSQYLLKIIASDTIQDYFKSSLKGIGVPNLHLEHIRTTLIPIPPINEQNKIAERIYQYYSLLDSIVQNIE
mgnify:CR=1 FL=1